MLFILICLAFIGLFSWLNNKEYRITVRFTDEKGTLLRANSETFYAKPYRLLSRSKLEELVPGYVPVKKFIFFKKPTQKLTIKFKPNNFDQEVKKFKNAKYVAATFQPMTVTANNGFQSDPYNTSRTYNGTKTGKDSLRLIYSNDSKNWEKLNISYPRLNVRDPSIAKINGYWYIVYTKGLIRTRNFKKWEKMSWPHSKMFANHFEWAPEFFKDKKGRYHIIMAGNSVLTHNFQLYISDFDCKNGQIKNNWKAIKGYDFPSNMIDGNLTYFHGRYVLFYKNEDVAKNKLTMAVSKNYLGPYTSQTLNVDLNSYTSAEGLEAVFFKKSIRLYVDPYIINNKNQSMYNGVHYTEEKYGTNNWSSLKAIKAPFIVRHFGILRNK